MLPAELKKLLISLQECDVSYLLAEGFTLKERDRLTLITNIEFWIKPSLDNGKRLFRALKIFGTPIHGIKPEQLAAPETQFVLYCRPYRLEFYTHIPGLDFEKAWQHRESFREGRLFVRLIGKTERMVAGQSIKRPPDDTDVVDL
jgi:hypothetical protein